MIQTHDIHIDQFMPLISPAEIKTALPISSTAAETVASGRRELRAVLNRTDDRLLVITGPCSIHDEASAMEYASRIESIRQQVSDTMLVIMRVYFEKPRTTVGWKGMINDPFMDGTHDMDAGLRNARKLLLSIAEMGVPTATEILDPITPQYLAGLICWTAIGARTTESQTHREMASGLSMPVGFKNNTDGTLDTAMNAIIAARSPQRFLGIDPDGKACMVGTTGNPDPHLVLRGGEQRPNYDSVSILEAQRMLRSKKLPEAIIVDCSHDNSGKDYRLQPMVWRDVLQQRLNGNDAIVGMMLESNIGEGRQPMQDSQTELTFGVSITDACISWETTEDLLVSAAEDLRQLRNA